MDNLSVSIDISLYFLYNKFLSLNSSSGVFPLKIIPLLVKFSVLDLISLKLQFKYIIKVFDNISSHPRYK